MYIPLYMCIGYIVPDTLLYNTLSLSTPVAIGNAAAVVVFRAAMPIGPRTPAVKKKSVDGRNSEQHAIDRQSIVRSSEHRPIGRPWFFFYLSQKAGKKKLRRRKSSKPKLE